MFIVRKSGDLLLLPHGVHSMPFGNITANTVTYEPRRPGVYQKAALAVGAPADEFRLSGASTNRKSKVVSVAVTRIKQKDFMPVGATMPVREDAIVTVNIQLPNSGSFTATEADALVSDINEFLTAATFTRLAAGEI